MTGILSLPDEILDKLLSYVSYDESSHLRLVCKRFDASAQRVLNQGFYKVEKYHARCLRKVKEQLPRRESERRKHPLATHCDILTAIETRLSLLGMTFMKYVELKYCCFIPGKVLDEIFKILRFVSTVSVPPRAHEILQELRDISSMAMEHFDEKIAPAFRSLGKAMQSISVTSYGAVTGPQPQTYATPNTLRTATYSLDLLKLHLSFRHLHNRYSEVKKENLETRRKLHEFKRKMKDSEKKQSEQIKVINEQNGRLTELEGKFVEYERLMSDIVSQLKAEKCPSSTISSLNGLTSTSKKSKRNAKMVEKTATDSSNSICMPSTSTAATKKRSAPPIPASRKKRQKLSLKSD